MAGCSRRETGGNEIPHRRVRGPGECVVHSIGPMTATIPLTEEERAAVDDGQGALDQLLARLATVPRPAGPTPPRPRNRHQRPAHHRHHQLKRRDDLTTEGQASQPYHPAHRTAALANAA